MTTPPSIYLSLVTRSTTRTAPTWGRKVPCQGRVKSPRPGSCRIFAYPMFTQSFKTIEDKVAVIQPIESRKKSQNHAFSFSQLSCDLVLQFDFYGAHSKDNCEPKKKCSFGKNELLKNNFKIKPSVRKELIQHTPVVCFHTTITVFATVRHKQTPNQNSWLVISQSGTSAVFSYSVGVYTFVFYCTKRARVLAAICSNENVSPQFPIASTFSTILTWALRNAYHNSMSASLNTSSLFVAQLSQPSLNLFLYFFHGLLKLGFPIY
eukprot:sb/3468341/